MARRPANDDILTEAELELMHIVWALGGGTVRQVMAELPPERDAVHTHLAASFEGEALTREYIEHYTALVRLARTDSAVTVLGVDYDDVLAVELGAEQATVEAEWVVRGRIRHGTHTHERFNRYQASYTLVHTENGPRIAGVRMKNLQRQEGIAPEGGLDQQTLDRLLGPD